MFKKQQDKKKAKNYSRNDPSTWDTRVEPMNISNVKVTQAAPALPAQQQPPKTSRAPPSNKKPPIPAPANLSIGQTEVNSGGNAIKDELGAVQMIKVMTREQKLLLNDMVQSVLVHQQNNEETDIKITHERRKLALAQI